MMNKIDVGSDFYHRLANRDKTQGDGKFTAQDFRKKYLSGLDNNEAWTNNDPFIVFDFSNVKKIGPSFANEAFAYFTTFAKKERIRKKIIFMHITTVQLATIKVELDAGYSR